MQETMTLDLEFDVPIAAELEQWAEHAVFRPGAAVVLDVETGPLSWPEIEQFFTPPAAPGEFDETTVKYGNTKDEAKRAAKLAECRANHQALVDGHTATVEAARQEFISKAALSAITGRVLAIGYHVPGVTDSPVIMGSNVVADVTEKPILADFWRKFSEWLDKKMTIVGHNLLAFDLPFLIRRSWKHGVTVSPGIRQGRWWNPLIRDTMVEWSMNPGMVKLDDLARFFGVGQKTEGVTGADFARLWTENRQLACEYLRNDVLMTSKVATAIGLI